LVFPKFFLLQLCTLSHVTAQIMTHRQILRLFQSLINIETFPHKRAGRKWISLFSVKLKTATWTTVTFKSSSICLHSSLSISCDDFNVSGFRSNLLQIIPTLCKLTWKCTNTFKNKQIECTATLCLTSCSTNYQSFSRGSS